MYFRGYPYGGEYGIAPRNDWAARYTPKASRNAKNNIIHYQSPPWFVCNMNYTTQLQKAAVVPMAGVEPAPFASLGWAVLRLLSYIGVSPVDRAFLQDAIKVALFA